jgi:hypothetical protein
MLLYAVSVAALYLGGSRHRAMKRISIGAVLVAAGLLGSLVVAGPAEFAVQQIGRMERWHTAEPVLAAPIRGEEPVRPDLSVAADF